MRYFGCHGFEEEVGTFEAELQLKLNGQVGGDGEARENVE